MTDDAPPIDIRPDHWAMVQAILRRHVPQHEVWVFGSRARHQSKRYSDLDLAIISDTPVPWRVLGELKEDFSESDLPWRVDVLDWATTSPGFQAIIARDKVVIQEAEPGS